MTVMASRVVLQSSTGYENMASSTGKIYPAIKSGAPVSKSLPLNPEQRIKELEQHLAETKERAQFFEALVKVMNT